MKNALMSWMGILVVVAGSAASVEARACGQASDKRFASSKSQEVPSSSSVPSSGKSGPAASASSAGSGKSNNSKR